MFETELVWVLSVIESCNNEVQLQISKQIRLDFCKKLNFSLSPEQFNTLNLIGNNLFITSAEELYKVEDCLLKLKAENLVHKTFNLNLFNLFLHKFWSDSCGNSNVGLAAYSIYSKSILLKGIKVSLDQKSKLLTKCLLRRFRTK